MTHSAEEKKSLTQLQMKSTSALLLQGEGKQLELNKKSEKIEQARIATWFFNFFLLHWQHTLGKRKGCSWFIVQYQLLVWHLKSSLQHFTCTLFHMVDSICGKHVLKSKI